MSREPAVRRVSAWNIANYLTVFRLCLVPVFGYLLLAHGGAPDAFRWGAWATFGIAMLTDRIDGDLARSRGLVTDFGKVVDPIADKALVTMALTGLSILGEIPWWLTAVVLVREWGVTLVRLWVIRLGVIAADRGGKLKTLLQAIALLLFLLPRPSLPFPQVWTGVAWIALLLAVVVTVVTGLNYVLAALRLRGASQRARAKGATSAE